MASGDAPSSSRSLRLSKLDSQGLRGMWKDDEEKSQAEHVVDTISDAFKTIIENLGDPRPDRDGLIKTPQRAARALCYFTKGYEETIESKFMVLLQFANYC